MNANQTPASPVPLDVPWLRAILASVAANMRSEAAGFCSDEETHALRQSARAIDALAAQLSGLVADRDRLDRIQSWLGDPANRADGVELGVLDLDVGQITVTLSDVFAHTGARYIVANALRDGLDQAFPPRSTGEAPARE